MAKDLVAEASIAAAPMPTPETLKLRQNLPFQASRFALISLNIMRMVHKGHAKQ